MWRFIQSTNGIATRPGQSLGASSLLLCALLISTGLMPGTLRAEDADGQTSAGDEHTGHHVTHDPGSSPRFSRVVRSYRAPDVTLVDAAGDPTSLSAALRHNGPLLLQFIFTTCPAVCPVLSGTFAAAQPELPSDTRMVSISIDPEHDTPSRMREYAERFRAGPSWLFLTGRLEDVVTVQKAFDAYRGNKMRHEPLTFVRATQAAPWVRLDGFLSAEQLVAEVRRLTAP